MEERFSMSPLAIHFETLHLGLDGLYFVRLVGSADVYADILSASHRGDVGFVKNGLNIGLEPWLNVCV